MRFKFFIFLIMGIFLIQLVSADIWVSPAEPIINGNNYVFITYNDSALNDTAVLMNITDPSGTLKRECDITLNEYGFGRCKYNFTTSDISGTWGYAVNTSVSGTFEVGKVTINTSIKDDLTSVKYGTKFYVEVNMTYENIMPKEIVPRAMGRDLGTHVGRNDYVDVDGDGDNDIVVINYNGFVHIWENFSRFYTEGTMLIAGQDFRTSDIGTFHITSGCIFEDFDGNGVKTMICGDYAGAQLEAWVNVDLTAGISVAPTFTGTDEGDTIRTAPIACDVDNDGLADQVAVNIYDGTMIVYDFNDSTGFTKTYESTDLGTGHYGSRGACADFDNDGYNEWMLCIYDRGCYFADVNHLGDHSVTLGDQQTDNGAYYGYGAAIDFDNDGIIEMLEPNTAGRMEMLEFNKSGTNLLEHDLAWATDTDVGSYAYGSGGLHFDDLNKNGRPDFVLTDTDADANFYEYNPVGPDWYEEQIYDAIENSYVRTAYADFDGDGIKEVLIRNRYMGNVYILKFNGESWDIIYEGWNEDWGEGSGSGDGKSWGVNLNSWLYGEECIEGDIDEDGLEEVVCFMYSGRQIIYEQADRVEENVTSDIKLSVVTNGADYLDPDDTIAEMRILNTGEFLVMKSNIALGITDVVDEDNQNQDFISTRWTDGILDESGFATQTTLDYSDLDSSGTEEATYSRIKLGNNYMVGAVKFWNYYSDGRSVKNVIVRSTADSTGNLCNFDINDTLFDNSDDGMNQRYSEGKTGKSVYFSPVNMSCLRESTSGFSGYTTTSNTGNYRTEIEIYETASVAEIELSVKKRADSSYSVKDNIQVQITASDRTGNVINVTATNVSIPVTYSSLPFSVAIVGGTEYYPGQEGQIVIQLKDEFNDAVTGATCLVDYYYPNSTLWLDDQATSELPGVGIYYDSFTLPNVDGVYIAVANCTSGTFSDIDSHTFHVSGILIDINNTLGDISEIVIYINQTIINTIIPYLEEINATTHTSYSYLTDTIQPQLNGIGENISYIRENMATASSLSSMQTDVTWLVNNVATQTNITETLNRLLTINNTINTISSNLLNINSSLQTKIDLIQTDTTWLRNNVAVQQNITSILSDTNWLVSNVATQENMTEIFSRLLTINNTINTISSNLLSINSSLQTEIDSIQTDVDWLESNVATNENITEIINRLTEINSTTNEIDSYLDGEITTRLTELNSTTNEIDSYLDGEITTRLTELNSTTHDIYTDTQNLLTKWGTYTAGQLYNISNATYIRTGEIYNDMATSSALSSMQTDVTWLLSNVATQTNITETLNRLLTINNTINTISSDLTSINSSLQTKIDLIQTDTTWLRNNVAVQSNITSILSDTNWLVSNVATQENMTEIFSRLLTINNTINTISSNLLSINSSLQTEIDSIQTDVDWLESNVATQTNITAIISDTNWLVSNVATQTNITETLSRLLTINSTINTISSDLLNINSSLQTKIDLIQTDTTWLRNNVAVQQNITSILSDTNWLVSNVATQTNITETLSRLLIINNTINSISSDLISMNSSLQTKVDSIQTDVNWLESNVATNENITEILSRLTELNVTTNEIDSYLDGEITSRLTEINSTTNEIDSYLDGEITTRLTELNTTTQEAYNYLQNTIYTRLNETYNNTQYALTYIGNPSDDENQNTLFGEHKYTQNRLTEIQGNLTELNSITSQINTTLYEVNSTVSTILTEVDDLEELHQCSISPNSTICTLLNNIKTDTTNIYSSVSSLSLGSGTLFEITSLVSASPKYANENAMIEATFVGQNGSAVTPDTINLTIYDPNNNIWTSVTKTDFTQGDDNIWKYSKSIGSSPTTGTYTAHLEASYLNITTSRVTQFRIATGGPYKIYLDCPANLVVGNELQCTVILQDEGESATESTSTVWIDTDNDLVADAGEPQMSFSKQTVAMQNVTQSISINVPSAHPSGLYVVRIDTSYANSAQPNSGASDSVTLTSTASEDTGGGTGGGSSGGSITGKVTEIICEPPYIRHGAECCLDANNNSICDVDEGLSGEEELEKPADEEEIPSLGPEFLDIKINKTYLFIGTGTLIAVLLLIFIIIRIIKHGGRTGKVKHLESKLQHLKELKSRKEISKSSYHSEKERLLSRINKILKGKHLILIIGSVGLIGLFSMLPKPNITGRAIGVGESNLGSISWWFVLVVLAVLALIGIFIVLIYILKEIRKFITDKASFIQSSNLGNILGEEKIIKQANKNINIKSTIHSLNESINKKVFTDSGHYIGEVKEVILGENKIDSLMIKLDKNQGFNVNGIIIKYLNVKSVGHVVIVDGEILEKTKSLKKV